jgi:hypothetical protein
LKADPASAQTSVKPNIDSIPPSESLGILQTLASSLADTEFEYLRWLYQDPGTTILFGGVPWTCTLQSDYYVHNGLWTRWCSPKLWCFQSRNWDSTVRTSVIPSLQINVMEIASPDLVRVHTV